MNGRDEAVKFSRQLLRGNLTQEEMEELLLVGLVGQNLPDQIALIMTWKYRLATYDAIVKQGVFVVPHVGSA